MSERSDDYTYPWGVLPNDTINREIATKVMGWTHDAGGWYWTGPVRTGDIDKKLDHEWLPSFDTEILQAFRVLDRLADLGYVILIKVDGQRPKKYRYNIIGSDGRLGADQSSVCMAICDAALSIMATDSKL